MKQLVNYHTILWADDDTDDLFIVKEVMENLEDNHQMIEVNNGKQVLDYLNSIEYPTLLPCLVILDINMPILNGKETLAIMKSEEKFNAITVAIFTTSSSEKDRKYCESFGARLFTKPHTFAGFQEVVGELLSLCSFRDRSVHQMQQAKN
jgi:CheY-like chemotaxis protein